MKKEIGWKDWSYAKRGFIIGLVIGIFLVMYLMFFGCNPMSPTLGGRGCTNFFQETIALLSFIIILPLMMIFSVIYSFLDKKGFEVYNTPLTDFINSVSYILIYLAVLSVLGTIIGFIIGKIKSPSPKK
ncbi:MAG: hypothetical protein ABIB79_04000 [archaeon]